MFVTSTELTPKIVEEYEFTNVNGHAVTFTVDRDAGDAIDFENNPVGVTIKIASRPNPLSPGEKTPEIEFTIYTGHVFTVQKIKREVLPLTVEQQRAWKQTIQEVSKTKH